MEGLQKWKNPKPGTSDRDASRYFSGAGFMAVHMPCARIISAVLSHVPAGTFRSGRCKAVYADGAVFTLRAIGVSVCFIFFCGSGCCGLQIYKEWSVPKDKNTHGTAHTFWNSRSFGRAAIYCKVKGIFVPERHK